MKKEFKMLERLRGYQRREKWDVVQGFRVTHVWSLLPAHLPERNEESQRKHLTLSQTVEFVSSKAPLTATSILSPFGLRSGLHACHAEDVCS